MRRLLFALVGLVLCSTAVRADDARAIIEKGLAASGRKVGDKSQALTWKDKGTFTASGVTMDYTADWAFQGPDKYRFALNGAFGELKIAVTVVTAGGKAWGNDGTKTEEFTGDKLAYTKAEAFQLWVGTLYPLVTEKGFALEATKGKDVAGKPTNAVQVTHPAHAPITLYFDRDTGLLVKSETTVKDEFQKWKAVPEEAFFSDYKAVGEQKVFTKLRVVRDGKPLIESTTSDHKAVEKLDAKLFEKP
jgi:hypothetical protein